MAVSDFQIGLLTNSKGVDLMGESPFWANKCAETMRCTTGNKSHP